MIGVGLQLQRWGSSQLGFLPSSLSLPELFLQIAKALARRGHQSALITLDACQQAVHRCAEP